MMEPTPLKPGELKPVRRLPRTRSLVTWVSQTERALQEMQAERQKLLDKRAVIDRQLKPVEVAVTTLRSLLEQVQVEEAVTATAKLTAGASRHDGRWARDYDACIDCGTSERKHASKGRCQTCQSAHQRQVKKDADS